jgi:hypothetical protein
LQKYQILLLIVDTNQEEIVTMDKLNYYQSIIKKILTEYADISSQVPDQDIEETLIFDDDRSQYLWFNIGWTNGKRIKAISVYLRLKNDKIYIEEDWTEAGIATELMRLGIPSSEIVLAFQPPEVRQFTEFAIA